MMVCSIRPMPLVAGVLGFAQLQANKGYLTASDGVAWGSGTLTYLVDNLAVDPWAEEGTGLGMAGLIGVGTG